MTLLIGKIALVTGGASGLGAAIARRLAEDGAHLIITDIQTAAGQALANELNGDFLEQDVTQEQQWNDVIAEATARRGGLHILVNNAGTDGAYENSDPESTSLGDWRKINSINVEGVFLGCRAALPAIHRTGGGSIINISSIAGMVPMPAFTAYGASKASVRHLTKSIAKYCIDKNYSIRCNSIHPGVVLTPMTQTTAKNIAKRDGISVDEIIQNWKSKVLCGEMVQAGDIADAVSFLASDKAKRITGTEFVVDAGSTLGR